MIEKLYLDMDGVLCNFERRYFELYGELPGSMRNRKEFSNHWEDFIMTKQFETLDMWPGAKKLILYAESLTVPVEILTSSGGNKFHDKVAEQKMVWLKTKGIEFPCNVVSGRKNKANYATPKTILVDDTADVIQAFNAAGGIGILHKEAGNTLMMLEKLLT